MENIFNYTGITIGENASCDSGICIINRNNELVHIDKSYSINELKECIDNLCGKRNSVICIDMPEYYEMLNGKWRIINKTITPLNMEKQYEGRDNWNSRYSDRGSEVYKNLLSQNYNVYRYCSNYAKTVFGVHSYVKERTPAGCKFLQMMVKDKLKIKNFPPNMLPVSVLDAMLGAYTAKVIATGEQDKDYEICYRYKNIDIYGVTKNFNRFL